MDHKVSKDMISSGMIPSGEKTQADLGRTQYGSAPSPSSLMEAYRSIYEHHQKDKDGNTIPHEDEQLNEGKMPEGLKNYLMKKKGKKEDKKDMKEGRVSGGGVSTSLPKQKQYQKVIDKLTGYEQTQKGVGAASLIPDSAFSNPNPRRSDTRPSPTKTTSPSPEVKPEVKPKPAPKPFKYKIDKSNMINTGLDLFDLVKGVLIDEGCDEQEAINIMVNLSEEELNEISEGLAGMALKLGGAALGAYGVKKAAEKMGTMSGTPKTPPAPKKPGLIQKLKDRKDATNKAIEQM